MTRTLKVLIKASGNSGAAGQSFRNHVTGAGTGARMSYYNLDSWEFSGGVPAPEVEYTGPYDFAMNVAFVQGSYAQYIKRTGAVITLTPTSTPPGSSVTLVANNVVAADTGSTVTPRVVAPYNPAATAMQHSGWFVGYVEPAEPSGTNPEPVEMFHSLSGASASGTQHVTWDLTYNPDLAAGGSYNPLSGAALSQSFDANMNNRGEVIADWEFEWHTNDTYTALAGSNWNHIFNSDPGITTTFWTRARRIGAGSWTNLGPVAFTDPREAV